MAGGNHPKSTSHRAPASSSHKPPSSTNSVSHKAPPSTTQSSSHRKSRWESSNNKRLPSDRKPNPSPGVPAPAQPIPPSDPARPPFPPNGPPFPFSEPLPPPAYGFHMLDRRTIALADGSVRTYFALPPDYRDFPPRHADPAQRFFDNRFMLPMSPDAVGLREPWNRPAGGPDGPGHMKRKFEDDRERQLTSMAGTSGGFDPETRAAKYMRAGVGGVGIERHNYAEVDQIALKKAFLHFAKLINENPGQRKAYLENGKQGRLHCVACRRFDYFSNTIHCF